MSRRLGGRAYLAAAALSVLIHIAGLGLWTLLCLGGFATRGHVTIRLSGRACLEALDLVTVASTDVPAVTIGREDLLNRLRAQMQAPAAPAEQDLLAELDGLTTRADTVRPESIGEIARFLGVAPGSYTPRDGTASLASDSLVYQDILPATSADGLPGVRIIWVDEDGRTVESELFGEAGEKVLPLVPVFAAFRAHPNLGAMYHDILKPLMGTLLREANRPAPPPDAPATPSPSRPGTR